MILSLILVSIVVASVAAAAAFLGGWGVIGALLVYSLGGSLTLLLLAAVVGLSVDDLDAGEDPL